MTYVARQAQRLLGGRHALTGERSVPGYISGSESGWWDDVAVTPAWGPLICVHESEAGANHHAFLVFERGLLSVEGTESAWFPFAGMRGWRPPSKEPRAQTLSIATEAADIMLHFPRGGGVHVRSVSQPRPASVRRRGGSRAGVKSLCPAGSSVWLQSRSRTQMNACSIRPGAPRAEAPSPVPERFYARNHASGVRRLPHTATLPNGLRHPLEPRAAPRKHEPVAACFLPKRTSYPAR